MEQSKFYQIKNVTEHEYTLVGCDGSVITRPIQDIDKTASAFTIQDAKDGDVLCYKDEVFILKNYVLFHKIVYHSCYDGEKFIPHSVYSLTKDDFNSVHPATKEQRDLLFKKMKEAGYEWDAEKKELKKEEVDNMHNYLYGEQNPAWSEGDEEIYYGVIETEQYMLDVVNGRKKFDVGNISIKEECDRELNWLKSLKDRVHPQTRWKPSDEQMENLSRAFNGGSYRTLLLMELYQDLKKLREE